MKTNVSQLLSSATEDGIPTPGTGCTSADAVALISRVNFSSVVRVFAAIEAIKAAGFTVDTSLDSIPAESSGYRVDPEFTSPRARATLSFAAKVAAHSHPWSIRDFLYLSRFRSSVGSARAA